MNSRDLKPQRRCLRQRQLFSSLANHQHKDQLYQGLVWDWFDSAHTEPGATKQSPGISVMWKSSGWVWRNLRCLAVWQNISDTTAWLTITWRYNIQSNEYYRCTLDMYQEIYIYIIYIYISWYISSVHIYNYIILYIYTHWCIYIYIYRGGLHFVWCVKNKQAASMCHCVKESWKSYALTNKGKA